jgi:predicted transport protein
LYKLLLNILLVFVAQLVFAQKSNLLLVSGTVYDVTQRNPIEAVSVLSSNGKKTVTDSLGKYTILVSNKDSIWFSMLGKATNKYPVDTIKNLDAFDVMIHLRVGDLPPVTIRNKYYRQDSIANRQAYAKVFNFKKPGLSLSSANPNTYIPGQVTVGLDLQELISMFQFKKNRSIAKLKERLLKQEQDKYIDYRFNKNFVRKITKLTGKELDVFMNAYRPNYEFLLTLNDLEFGCFIQRDFEHYKLTRH